MESNSEPPAAELRRLIVENAGEYHHYYTYGKTTYMVATNLSSSKWASMRCKRDVLRPEWIVERY